VTAAHLWTVDGLAAHPAVGPDGTLWTADVVRNVITVLDRDGNVIETWGTPGSGPGEFDFGQDETGGRYADLFFLPDGSFLVAECGNGRVEWFDARRNLVRSIGEKGDGQGQFRCPSGVVVTGKGDVFVADIRLDKIERFGADGDHKYTVARLGAPAQLDLDGDGNIVAAVSDPTGVVVFDPEGRPIRRFGAAGTQPGQLVNPIGAVVDEAGNFYVADGGFPVVSVFDPSGAFLGSFDAFTAGADHFTSLGAIGYGGHGSVYVTDCLPDRTCRLMKFAVTVSPPPDVAPPASPPR
jgi:sugar lactone lactonase YvrE